MRITDNTYNLSGEAYGALGEVYAARTDQGVILIDCGSPETGYANVKENLASCGLAGARISHVILTHGHWDHCGSAKSFQDDGAVIIVGQEDSFMCVNGGNGGLDTPHDVDEHIYPAFKPDIEIKEDSEMEISGLMFGFIKIPGHTAGSTAVLLTVDQKTFLFTGDALQPSGAYHIDGITFGWQGDINFSRENIISSMNKLLRKVTADCILPGHGAVCRHSAAQGGADRFRHIKVNLSAPQHRRDKALKFSLDIYNARERQICLSRAFFISFFDDGGLAIEGSY
ncbi:MAG: MBL fold metallo-hydrolase [Clostridiales bacterium]|jgi:glyoxylase-like metal-dependent hydrolase (beta-lactamase superfamily II)|nr:MBL fold metallo-hydrolase [Clostridiales bacterium]